MGHLDSGTRRSCSIGRNLTELSPMLSESEKQLSGSLTSAFGAHTAWLVTALTM